MSDRPQSKHANLLARVGVALVGAPILIAAMYQASPLWVWGLVFIASMLAMNEYFAMTLQDDMDRRASLLCGAVAVLAMYWLPAERLPYLASLFAATVPPALYYVFRFGDMATAGVRMAQTVTGILYAGMLFTFLAIIKRDVASAGVLPSGHLLLLVVATPWLSDTGAYFAGRALGKTKLYPSLSPGKTRAGALGGLAGALAMVAAMKLFALASLSWMDVAVIGGVGGALCQLGDLFESMIKRSTGVKDSGSILPGHGGILDRVDAVLFFAPFVYLYNTLAR